MQVEPIFCGTLFVCNVGPDFHFINRYFNIRMVKLRKDDRGERKDLSTPSIIRHPQVLQQYIQRLQIATDCAVRPKQTHRRSAAKFFSYRLE